MSKPRPPKPRPLASPSKSPSRSASVSRSASPSASPSLVSPSRVVVTLKTDSMVVR
jgi:hypothetical protein